VTVAPTGTVIFLFTDIEGSTQLWEHRPALMQRAVSRHDQLLRECIEAHDGYVFTTVGDAFCAVFPAAEDGLCAALDAQRVIYHEPWDPTCVIRVRMALHVGAAEMRDQDYFGPQVNRAARLMSAGHGGQTLLSQAMTDAVANALPKGIQLRDLGAHRLKDLVEPEHIYQLYSADLPQDFPPITALDYRPTNLPVQPTDFVGRERELAAVEQLLRRNDVRLLTLTGPAGTGKTRLALQAAANLVDEMPGGVYLVSLAPITDAALILSVVAGALHVREAGGWPLQELVIDHLRDKQVLLVLDNFEHVLAAGPTVSQLLSACPSLTVLTTSRAVLRLAAEHEYAVPPLSVPDPAHLSSLEEVARSESVTLFVERSRAIKPDFNLTGENAAAVVAICRRLDGLPLAIELAAARIRLLSPDALFERLTRRLRVLTGGARDLPERQQTLRGAIDWSYDLLDPAEQRLFAALSVFAGGCTLEAAEMVCGGERRRDIDVFEGVESLVEKSLLRRVEQADEPRFVMLETIREYATECLDASGEAEELRERHARTFLGLAEKAEPAFRRSDEETWAARLELDHDNFRAALARLLTAEDSELALRLSSALQEFWFAHGHLTEGRRWLEASLARSARSSPARAKTLAKAGLQALSQGDFAAARVFLAEGVDMARAVGPAATVADALYGLAVLADIRGDPSAAQSLLEEALALYRKLEDTFGVGASLNELAAVVLGQGDLQRAEELYGAALTVARQLGQKRAIGWQLNNLACVAHDRGDYPRARELLNEALEAYRETGDKYHTASALAELGMVTHRLQDHAGSEALMQESLTLLRELNDQVSFAQWLEMQASMAALEGRPERAARLLGSAAGVRDAAGAPLQAGEEARHEHDLEGARASLGEGWSHHWERGKAMRLEEAVEYAVTDHLPAHAQLN
jgi:predicted ATPase/class 3 adenylate cyclase